MEEEEEEEDYSLTRVKAAPLSPVVGRSDCARCGRLTIIASRLPTPLRPPIDTGAGDRGGAPPSHKVTKFSVVAETVGCRKGVDSVVLR